MSEDCPKHDRLHPDEKCTCNEKQMTTQPEPTAEEIVGYKEVIDSMTSWEEYYREKHAKELLDLVLEQSAAQRLSELKEKAKDLDYRSIWEDDKEILLVEREELIQLIEEVRDE